LSSIILDTVKLSCKLQVRLVPLIGINVTPLLLLCVGKVVVYN